MLGLVFVFLMNIVFNKGTPFFGEGGGQRSCMFLVVFLKNDIFQIEVCGISGRFATSFWSLAVGLPKQLAPTDLGGVGGCFGHTSCTFVFISFKDFLFSPLLGEMIQFD